MTRLLTLFPAAALAAVMIASPAHSAGGLFDNCTNFNKTFPHGVGKKYAHDHTSGTPVTNFLHSNKKYATAMKKNADLDRDRDKIACERA